MNAKPCVAALKTTLVLFAVLTACDSTNAPSPSTTSNAVQKAQPKKRDTLKVSSDRYIQGSVAKDTPVMHVSMDEVTVEGLGADAFDAKSIPIKEGKFVGANDSELGFEALNDVLKKWRGQILKQSLSGSKKVGLTFHPKVPYGTIIRVVYALGQEEMRPRLVAQQAKSEELGYLFFALPTLTQDACHVVISHAAGFAKATAFTYDQQEGKKTTPVLHEGRCKMPVGKLQESLGAFANRGCKFSVALDASSTASDMLHLFEMDPSSKPGEKGFFTLSTLSGGDGSSHDFSLKRSSLPCKTP